MKSLIYISYFITENVFCKEFRFYTFLPKFKSYF